MLGCLQARLQICDSCRSSETALGQASVRAERRCRTTSNHYFAAYTGFESQKGSRSGWRCWCIAASMVLHPATWRQISSASLTLTLVGNCALRVRQHLSVHILCVLASATVYSWQLPHLFGTVCESQFGHCHHCQFFMLD